MSIKRIIARAEKYRAAVKAVQAEKERKKNIEEAIRYIETVLNSPEPETEMSEEEIAQITQEVERMAAEYR